MDIAMLPRSFRAEDTALLMIALLILGLLIALLVTKVKLKLTLKQTLSLIPYLLAAPLDWLVWGLLIFFRRSFWNRLGSVCKGVSRYYPMMRQHFRLDGGLTAWVFGSVAVVYIAWYAVRFGTDEPVVMLIGLVLGLFALLALIWFVPKWYVLTLPDKVPSEKDEGALVPLNKLKSEEGFRVFLGQIMGGIVLLTGLYYGSQELQLAREGQLTERFTRAVDQLGHKEMEVRIGGIFALEKIAYDHKEYHWTVIEVLTAYIRARAPWPPKEWDEKQVARLTSQYEMLLRRGERKKAREVLKSLEREKKQQEQDFQIALTVIGRRNLKHESSGGRRLDLTNIDLGGAQLGHAHLERAILEGARLEGAWLRWAHLEGADLDDVHLEGAILDDAHLQGAKMRSANLQHAFLRGANLEGANLEKAYLQGAILSYANLEGARLRGAHLEDVRLWDANLKNADLWAARLEGASLDGVHLQGADLSYADMQGASGLTWEQLELARSFKGAWLPLRRVRDIQDYRKAEKGEALLNGYPVPEGYE